MVDVVFPFWVAVIGVGIALQVLGLVCFLISYLRKLPPLPQGPLPGVTIVKPCHGVSDHEDINFDSFFNQNYKGPLELIFSVSEETDASVPVIRKFIQRYPHVDAKLLISKTRKAYWQKIDAYDDGYKAAKHDIFIISDSDAIVEPSYVSKMVACLSEPGVSFVTTPQCDTGINNIPTAIKTLGNNCDLAVFVSIMDVFTKNKKVSFGHSIGFRRSEFDTFGEEAWERVRHYFGDDLILPLLFFEHGKKVVFRNISCPVRFSDKTFGQMLHQQRRFAICQKVALGTWSYSFGLLLFPQITSAVYLLATGFSKLSIILFLSVWALKVFISLVFEGLVLKNIIPTLKYFWVLPIWDILKAYFVFSSFSKDHLEYHGRMYQVKSNSRVVEVKSGSFSVPVDTQQVSGQRENSSEHTS